MSEHASISASLVLQAVLTASLNVVISVGIAVPFSAFLTINQSYRDNKWSAVCFSSFLSWVFKFKYIAWTAIVIFVLATDKFTEILKLL